MYPYAGSPNVHTGTAVTVIGMALIALAAVVPGGSALALGIAGVLTVVALCRYVGGAVASAKRDRRMLLEELRKK